MGLIIAVSAAEQGSGFMICPVASEATGFMTIIWFPV
jgi:hypothetical protein